MPNPRLSEEQLKKAHKLLGKIRKQLVVLSKNDKELLFAYRRKVYKELSYDERGKPAHRKKLQQLLWKKQNGYCASCGKKLDIKYSERDRKKAIDGYIEENVRLIHQGCHRLDQEKQGNH